MIQNRQRIRNQKRRKEQIPAPQKTRKEGSPQDVPLPPDLQREGPDPQNADQDLHDGLLLDAGPPLQDAGPAVLSDGPPLTNANGLGLLVALGHLAAPNHLKDVQRRGGRKGRGVRRENREAKRGDQKVKRNDQEVKKNGQKVRKGKANLPRKRELKTNLLKGSPAANHQAPRQGQILQLAPNF